MLHGHGYDTQIRDKFLQIHATRVSNKRVGHISDTTKLHYKSVRAT